MNRKWGSNKGSNQPCKNHSLKRIKLTDKAEKTTVLGGFLRF